MNWLDLVASVVGSVTWPIVVVILAFKFKETIIVAGKHLRRFKAPGLEAEFGDSLADAEENTQALLDAAGVPNDELGGAEVTQGTSDPTGTIIRAWQGLSVALNEVAKSGGPSHNPSRSTTALIRRLRDEGEIETTVSATLLELRELRNAVAHGKHEPTAGEALTYAETARELRAYLMFTNRGVVALR